MPRLLPPGGEGGLLPTAPPSPPAQLELRRRHSCAVPGQDLLATVDDFFTSFPKPVYRGGWLGASQEAEFKVTFSAAGCSQVSGHLP